MQRLLSRGKAGRIVERVTGPLLFSDLRLPLHVTIIAVAAFTSTGSRIDLLTQQVCRVLTPCAPVGFRWLLFLDRFFQLYIQPFPTLCADTSLVFSSRHLCFLFIMWYLQSTVLWLAEALCSLQVYLQYLAPVILRLRQPLLHFFKQLLQRRSRNHVNVTEHL